MKSCKSKYIMGSVLAVALGLSCAGSQGAESEGEYACQVKAKGGNLGLVLTQAYTLKQAEKMALGSEAMTTDGGRATATAIVECIRDRERRFKDIQFQNFFESIPL